MSLRRILMPLVCLAAVACTPPSSDGAAQSADGASSAPAAAVACDSPAAPLAIGAAVDGSIPAAQNYPENARYYCVNVPAGVSQLTLVLSGMSVDLDLYVGSGSIQSVQGVDISAGGNYQWKSNEFGTGDERVVITAPEPGIYYAEIVSFQGQASTYHFAAQ